MIDPVVDPYAVGEELADAPAQARRPTRALPFLWALLVLSLGAPGELWQPLTLETLRGDFGVNLSQAATFLGLVSVPLMLSPVWALLSDRLPLAKARREGYLTVACVMASGAWVAGVLAPWSHGPWLAICLTLSLAMAIGRSSCEGALVELARQPGAPTRLAIGLFATPSLAQLAWAPARSLLGDHSLRWWAGLAVALALSVASLALVSSDGPPERESAVDDRPVIPLRAFLRSRTFWCSSIVITCSGALSTRMVGTSSLFHATEADQDRRFVLYHVICLTGAAAYWLWRRRKGLRALLLRAMVLQFVMSVSAAALLNEHPWIASAITMLAATPAGIARFELALRVAPRRSEAFGFQLVSRGFPFVLFGGAWHYLAMYGGAGAFKITNLVLVPLEAVGLLAIYLLPEEAPTERSAPPIREGG